MAVNRTTIVNASPALDFGSRLPAARPQAESALSAPLVSNGQLVGVLTLYAATKDAFSDDHRGIIELVGRQIAAAIAQAARYEQSRKHALIDEGTGLPNETCLAHLLASRGFAETSPLSFGVLCLDVCEGKTDGDGADRAVRELAANVRAVVRVTDLVFRLGPRELIVLMPDTRPHVTRRVAERIVKAVGKRRAGAPPFTTRIGTAFAPDDGRGVGELLQKARQELVPCSETGPICAEVAQTCAGT